MIVMVREDSLPPGYGGPPRSRSLAAANPFRISGMKNIFLINAHQYYPVAEGRLNQALVERARKHLEESGHEVRLTTMKEDWDVEQELEKHTWADAVIVQTPVYWMGIPAIFKKYVDSVYSAGTEGRLCAGDGRTRSDSAKQYGSGGVLTGTKYMLSLTFNAPSEAFDDPAQKFFAGRGVDDLFLPLHLTFRFFGMTPLRTFVCYDVMKNPQIENDFARFEAHLDEQFPPASVAG
jgi:NADPH dehydrogenase (quinone)